MSVSILHFEKRGILNTPLACSRQAQAVLRHLSFLFLSVIPRAFSYKQAKMQTIQNQPVTREQLSLSVLFQLCTLDYK